MMPKIDNWGMPGAATTADLRQALRDVFRSVEARFKEDRGQIERLQRQNKELKAELAECKRELKAVSPAGARYFHERQGKRKHPNYVELDLQPEKKS